MTPADPAAAPPPDDPRHGTSSGYFHLKCRCERCRAAWAEYHLAGGYSARYRSKIRSRETPARYHGTHTGYTNYGCRCEMCCGIPRGQRTRLRWRGAALAERAVEIRYTISGGPYPVVPPKRHHGTPPEEPRR